MVSNILNHRTESVFWCWRIQNWYFLFFLSIVFTCENFKGQSKVWFECDGDLTVYLQKVDVNQKRHRVNWVNCKCVLLKSIITLNCYTVDMQDSLHYRHCRYSFIQRTLCFTCTNINKLTKDTFYSVNNIRKPAVKIFTSFGIDGLYSKCADKGCLCNK